MEWNNGTVFRVFINSNNIKNVGGQTIIDAKLDIGQQELNNNCFIGIEQWHIKPLIDGGGNIPNPGQNPPIILSPRSQALQNFWAQSKFIQFSSPQLPPYIDFTVQDSRTSPEFNEINTRNTLCFGRLPVEASPQFGNAAFQVEASIVGDRVLNKDTIMYDMRNNPMALSNGRLLIALTDETGEPYVATRLNTALQPELFVDPDETMIEQVSLTLVVYKSTERYN